MFEPIKIVRVITEEVGSPQNDGTRGSGLYEVPIELSRVPPAGWANAFQNAFDKPESFTQMHQPGIASVSGQKVILERTTLEMVGKYHKPILEAAVERANAAVVAAQAAAALENQKAKASEEEHRRKVAVEAAKIKF